MNAIKYYDYAANLQKKNNAIHEKNMIKKIVVLYEKWRVDIIINFNANEKKITQQKVNQSKAQ